LALYNGQSRYEHETIASVLEYAGIEEEDEAAVMLEKIVERFPEDIFTLKLAHIFVRISLSPPLL
jgi:hypothetical protein